MGGYFSESKVWGKGLNVFLNFIDGLFSTQCGFSIKERMYEEIGLKSHDSK